MCVVLCVCVCVCVLCRSSNTVPSLEPTQRVSNGLLTSTSTVQGTERNVSAKDTPACLLVLCACLLCIMLVWCISCTMLVCLFASLGVSCDLTMCVCTFILHADMWAGYMRQIVVTLNQSGTQAVEDFHAAIKALFRSLKKTRYRRIDITLHILKLFASRQAAQVAARKSGTIQHMTL